MHNLINRMMNLKACFVQAFFCCVLFSLSGCSSVESRLSYADDLAMKSGAHSGVIQTGEFPLFFVQAFDASSKDHVTVFIEGDGYAWVDRYTVSDNPTPKQPLALQMALSNGDPSSFYLARPCQYVWDQKCTPSVWSYDRFSGAVIASYMSALDQMKRSYGVQKLDVVGFSGGAYIALVLASKRDDISSVTTVAGLLDPDEWAKFHDISPLRLVEKSDYLIQKSQGVAFSHICGVDDDVTPCSLTERFVGKEKNHTIIKISDQSHDQLWRYYREL